MKTFIDLFAGLGGFHIGLSQLGMKCVFASEIDKNLALLYEKNFGIRPHGDIRNVREADIPQHDVLCAGFPCQPFSAAGKKKGAKCPKSGKLIDEVLRIAKYHQPKYVLLENVPQILTIQNNEFWNYVVSEFDKIGYKIQYKIYSPEEFGIPQHRKRVFVIAYRDKPIVLPELTAQKCNIESILRDDISHKEVEKDKINILKHWQLFLSHIKNISSHTVLSAEFGASYPIEDLNNLSLTELKKYKGAFGKDLTNCTTRSEVYNLMPEYIRKNEGRIPKWIKSSIINSRKIYDENKVFLDVWKEALPQYTSWQKLEWRAERKSLDIWKNVIQFRASGIRISKPLYAPSLVAMTPTQVPIIGKYKRYLSPKEASTLQAMQVLKYLPENSTKAFKALGNAVNAKIINFISQQLVA